jgi:hypothetical protein
MNVEEFHLLKRLPIDTRLPTCGARSTPMSGSGWLLKSARTLPSIPWRKLRLTSSDKEASGPLPAQLHWTCASCGLERGKATGTARAATRGPANRPQLQLSRPPVQAAPASVREDFSSCRPAVCALEVVDARRWRAGLSLQRALLACCTWPAGQHLPHASDVFPTPPLPGKNRCCDIVVIVSGW